METTWKGEELKEADKVDGYFDMVVSFEVLKKALNLKDNIWIDDIIPIRDRNRIVRLRLVTTGMKGKVAVGDIYPQVNLKDIQK